MGELGPKSTEQELNAAFSLRDIVAKARASGQSAPVGIGGKNSTPSNTSVKQRMLGIPLKLALSGLSRGQVVADSELFERCCARRVTRNYCDC